MRNLILITLLISLSNCKAQNQNNMELKIKEIIASFEKAAASRDINQLSRLLHKDYRVVANRFKGSRTAQIISKEAYLEMMKDEKVGGTSYVINFNDIKITEHTAIADILYVSDIFSDMHKYLVLVKDENDQWKIVSDIPIVME